jgi:hypothetical protein
MLLLLLGVGLALVAGRVQQLRQQQMLPARQQQQQVQGVAASALQLP